MRTRRWLRGYHQMYYHTGVAPHRPNFVSPRITDVLAVPASGGYFADDQAAITAGAVRDGVAYVGGPVTKGFDAIRTPAGAVSVLLVLSDGYIAHGDCASVQYSGVGG